MIDGVAAPNEALPVSYWLKERYADIEEVSPVCPYLMQSFTVQWHDDAWVRARALGVESNFFTFFSFPLLSGNPETVLQDEYSAVVSQTFARKLFGSEDPIGQSFRISDSTTLVVSGVMKDIAHSMIPYADILYRIERVEEFNDFIAKDNASNAGACANFYKLYPGKDLNAHREDILDMFRERYWIYRLGYAQDVRFVPLKDAYFEGFGT
ncbi:MAG: ABC transporter permease, partial [Bacteroidales bacterium]|nr:ABC transporter permease [Bacteroidales bacterium]